MLRCCLRASLKHPREPGAGVRHRNDNRAGLHTVNNVLLDEDRSLAAEYLCGRDNDISLFADLGLGFLLLGDLLGSEFFGVALGCLAHLAQIDLYEVCAEGFDLLFNDRSPATPTPITNTLAGFMVPAGVTIIGRILGMRAAALSTATYPARDVCED